MVNELVRASAEGWCSGASKRVRASSAALRAGALVLRFARVERWNGVWCSGVAV